jgi:hypothetical protein
MLFPAPAAKPENELIDRKVKRAKETYDFHESTIGSYSPSNPGMCGLGKTTLLSPRGGFGVQYYD